MVASFNIDYSLKNIPVCSKSEYLDLFVARLAQFIRNIKWKAWHIMCPDAKHTHKDTYGFKSRRAPPAYCARNYGEEWTKLKSFEMRLYDMVRQIRFAPYTNEL